VTALVTTDYQTAHLAPLGGWWVLAYRLLWAILALAALALTSQSLTSVTAHPAFEALRLLKGTVLVGVSAILLWRRKDDLVAALLSLAFLTWTITSSFDFVSAAVVPTVLDRVRFLLFAVALLLFPDGRWVPEWTRGLAFLSAAVALLGIAEAAGLAQSRLYLPLAIACVVAAVATLLLRFRSADTESVRQQLKWVALGLVVGVCLILAARAGAAIRTPSLALRSMPILWEAMFQLGIVVVALGFLVSLLRYRLFDAETAITRSASYLVLTIALVATFAATEAAIEWAGQQYLGMSIGNFAAAVAAAIAAAALGPLHHSIGAWAEERFQRDLAALKAELPELLVDLSIWANLGQIGRVALPRIRPAIHAEHVDLIIDGKVVATEGTKSTGLPSTQIELRFPAGMSGQLALGRRPDGTRQARDELETIATIAPALSRAVWMAAHRDRERERERRFRRSVTRKFNALSERIGWNSPALRS
jgi:hypothetical protein